MPEGMPDSNPPPQTEHNPATRLPLSPFGTIPACRPPNGGSEPILMNAAPCADVRLPLFLDGLYDPELFTRKDGMDRRIAHPDVKTPIKTWYKGHYEHVFFALYPFCRIISENPMRSQDAPYERLLGWDEIPDDFDEIMKLRGETIRWSEVHETVAPEVSKHDFYLAVWLSIHPRLCRTGKHRTSTEDFRFLRGGKYLSACGCDTSSRRRQTPFELKGSSRRRIQTSFIAVDLSLSCFQKHAPTAVLPQAIYK